MGVTDLTYIRKVSDGNEELVRELIDIFVSQVPEFYKQMQESLATKSWDTLGAVAHKARSSTASMGMQETAHALERLEMLGKALYVDEHSDDHDSQTDNFRRQVTTLPDDLAAWLSQNKNERAANELINFYKLHSEIAIAELINK